MRIDNYGELQKVKVNVKVNGQSLKIVLQKSKKIGALRKGARFDATTFISNITALPCLQQPRRGCISVTSGKTATQCRSQPEGGMARCGGGGAGWLAPKKASAVAAYG